jgi:carboxymethylenebutenolidase
MSTIRIDATDGSGSFDAFVAEPAGGTPAGAVVVIQEIFGVNDAMKDTCNWVADMGFLAIAPDLFWRQEPNVDITDKSEAEWQKAFALMNGFDQAKGIDDLKATLAAARKHPGCNGKAGTMGYCLGGRMAFMMATRSDADINVSYYGVGLDGLLGEVPQASAPLLLHIAELDKFVPPEARTKILEATKAKPTIHSWVYPGADHAFARPHGISWNARAATIANGRSAEALTATLG